VNGADPPPPGFAPPDVVLRLEKVGLATWPALEIARFDGWDLRAAAGVTKRSNSVSPLAASTVPLEVKIAHCENWYRERRLPPCFRLTGHSTPDLEPALAARGYVQEAPVTVMVRPVTPADVPSPVRVDDLPGDEWFARLVERRFDPGTPGAVVREMLERRTAPTVFASIPEGDDIVAMGIGALHDGHVAIYAMHTVPDRRRRGLGRLVLDGLMGWGGGAGATTAFLQVHTASTAAHAMYEDAGFTAAYRYWYRTGR